MRSFVLACPLLLALAGCYGTPEPECAFLCGSASACPEGYFCAGDGWCKRQGVAEDFQCSAPIPDAAPDATVVDGGPDAGDAGEDASPGDAAPDAPPGTPDAMPMPDATPPADAMPPPDAVPPPDATVDAMADAMVDAMVDAA